MNYNDMSTPNLRKYILSNREDKEAFAVYIARMSPSNPELEVLEPTSDPNAHVTPEEITFYRDQLKDLPGALEGMDAIEVCGGDLEKAFEHLLIEHYGSVD